MADSTGKKELKKRKKELKDSVNNLDKEIEKAQEMIDALIAQKYYIENEIAELQDDISKL